MCTLVIRREPGARWPLILAANRDEVVQRPWQAPARHWPEQPHVVAGLDEQAGGTWLGLNDHGLVAAVLNRPGFQRTLHDKRSRGLLVLDALEEPDARAAAEAIADVDPNAYQPFNLVVADAENAYWLKHAGPDATETERDRIRVEAIPEGTCMLTGGNLNDATEPRIRRFLPEFARASVPDPEAGTWQSWIALLGQRPPADAADPREGMTFTAPGGVATLCSELAALPHPEVSHVSRVLYHADGPPDRARFRRIDLEAAPAGVELPD